MPEEAAWRRGFINDDKYGSAANTSSSQDTGVYLLGT